jgi:hypothetical protein
MGLILASPALARADRLTQHWKEALEIMEKEGFTLEDAIKAAESHVNGKAVSIHSVKIDQSFWMWVNCQVEGKCRIVFFDVRSRKITKVQDGQAADMSCAWAEEALKIIEQSKITLLKAIEVAEEYSKGKAASAMSIARDGDLIFRVCCKVGDKPMVVTVDGKTGEGRHMKEAKEQPRPGG